MKKIIVCIILSLICLPFMAAEEINLENLKAAHIVAMKANGHADLLAGREASIMFMPCGKTIASALYGDNLCTAYMEKGDIKIYWYVEKIANGVLVTLKFTVSDITYSRSFKFTMTENEAKFAILEYAKEDTSRISIDWNCLIGKIPKCISCLTNWVCWLGCAGMAAWDCVDWREMRQSDGFGCPKCGNPLFYYAHYCYGCSRCFNASMLTCPFCYSQKWTNGKICCRCSYEYK